MTKPRAYISAFLILALLTAATVTYGIVNSQPDNGVYDTDGDGLIEIHNLEQLNAIRHDLNGNGQPDSDSVSGAYAAVFPVIGAAKICADDCKGYELARSLDFNDAASYAANNVRINWTMNKGWQPIASGSHYHSRDKFNAVFDGNGHTISNLYIYQIPPDRNTWQTPSGSFIGLFGSIGEAGVIREIGLVSAAVTGGSRVGGLAGINSGAISGSYVTGSISGNHTVGGLAGDNDGTIDNSHANAGVTGNSPDVYTESHTIGGLVGGNDGTISNSYASGKVSGNESLGGLVGKNGGTIRNSYATGNVSGDSLLGGLVGNNNGNVIASYANGSVSSEVKLELYEDVHIGGLAGSNGGLITASYVTGSVSVIAQGVKGALLVGGLSGDNERDALVIASYAIGEISVNAPDDVELLYVGGLIGYNYEDGEVIASFWNIQTSGQTTAIGNGVFTGAQGMTTAELQAPTGYQGIYRAWNVDLDNADNDSDTTTGRDDFWDFGSADRYPLLKVDFNADGIATWQESGNQMNDQPAATPAPTPTPDPTPPATPGPTPTPTPQASGGFVALSSGANHVCGLRGDGAVACWGDNSEGQASPPESGRFTAISSGDTHTCGLRTDGAIVCWGSLSGIFTGTE